MKLAAIAFDLDDTLLRDDRSLSPYTLAVLRRAAETGARVIPASGRTRDSMRGYVEEIGCAAFFIACNGAEVWSADMTPLRRVTLSVDLAREVARFADERHCYAQTYAGDRFFYNRRGAWADAYAVSSSLKGEYVGNLESYLTEETPKILLMDDPERIVALMAEAKAVFGDRVALTCSKPYFLEVNPPGASKGAALRWCAERFGFDLADTFAFGDSLNDLAMLQTAGHGVAVANARLELRRSGLPLCGSNQEDGVAHYLAQYLSGGIA